MPIDKVVGGSVWAPVQRTIISCAVAPAEHCLCQDPMPPSMRPCPSTTAPAPALDDGLVMELSAMGFAYAQGCHSVSHPSAEMGGVQ